MASKSKNKSAYTDKNARLQEEARKHLPKGASRKILSQVSQEIAGGDIEQYELDFAADFLALRPYQVPVFKDHQTGILVLHWSRQIGKSFVLAAWAVQRLLLRPGRLVTVLSNSRDNGAEFLAKCAEVCRIWNTRCETSDQSRTLDYHAMRMELTIRKNGRVGRIKVLAANPRTARGFSGDLILDEFAFHEDSAAIWEAAEPILASSADFLCRIASTGNGKHNVFYQMVRGAAARESGKDEGDIGDENVDAGAPVTQPSTILHPPSSQKIPPGFSVSASGFFVSRLPRSGAWRLGCKIFDPTTRGESTPEQARDRALDKRAYDQNYECSFADESLTLLTYELISAAEQADVGDICEQHWSGAALARLRGCNSPLFAGFDVARKGDLSVITVVEKLEKVFFVRAILRMRDLRLPEQQERFGVICELPQFQRVAIDMTGLGLGLVEFAQAKFGGRKIQGVNFARTVPVTNPLLDEGRGRDSVRVTEAMALEVLRAYEERRVRQPADSLLRDDLRKPERVTSPGGRVSIAATRDEAGHADHFWSLALALEAAATARPAKMLSQVQPDTRLVWSGWRGVL